jgi:hypothetical protein
MPKGWVALSSLALAVMVGTQILYGWHCHRIKPRTFVLRALQERPDLVLIDRVKRGYVLQVAELLPGDQMVWVGDGSLLVAQLAAGAFDGYRRMAYLPMEKSILESKPEVLTAFAAAQWKVRELNVVHPGAYEAILLSKQPDPEQTEAIPPTDSIRSE